MVTYNELTDDEKEALQYLGGYCDLNFVREGALDSLVAKGLGSIISNDSWYGPEYAITDLGRGMIDSQTFDWQEYS